MARKTLRRILYVEDEQDIQEIARMSLETVGGFTVKTCGSGQEAIDSAPKFKPDMILLDVMMPGMDGVTTMAKLRENPALADTPIVFVTARVQSHDIREYLGKGAAAVITKPFDPMQLPDEVRGVWEKIL
ncbi:MAG: response regulator [Leptospirales bacterium]|jgi:two-component system OmpR family response regulator